MRFFDGTNHPAATTILADGFQGAIMYAGTPASLTGKDVTAATYADYKAHGLYTVLCYESTASDLLGGASGGAAHALALWTDCAAKRIDVRDPVCATVDMHVDAAGIETAVAYQRSFRDNLRTLGWLGPIGVYGFPEVLVACHGAGVADWYWGAGPRDAQPPYVNVWQDNTQTVLVGGAPDDVDWVLISLPSPADPPAPIHRGGNMLIVGSADKFSAQALASGGLKTNLDPVTAGADATVFPRLAVSDEMWDDMEKRTAAVDALPGKVDAIGAKVDALATQVSTIVAAVQAADKDVLGAITAEQAALLAAIQAEGTAQVSPTALQAALTAANVPGGIISALAALFAKPPASPSAAHDDSLDGVA